MKKLLYSVLVAFAIAIGFSSCTEEEVKPTEKHVGGGNLLVDKGM